MIRLIRVPSVTAETLQSYHAADWLLRDCTTPLFSRDVPSWSLSIVPGLTANSSSILGDHNYLILGVEKTTFLESDAREIHDRRYGIHVNNIKV